ncbi:GGDEF domain-containing protein [Shewanella sp. Choline-02u-19]|uniref:EAL domain-containing protein n=1 Tax=unclassified Shewanella TaxID=196818 RepID=UPI000C32612B|nr:MULTISPECIES: GGDEF domain-containing protein [unclassified Shewanella]PKH55934.1 GGDEF domain-containing protein [Shewanella sp. Bg11-22]PKI27380.1 GGDEF domain-containing protein [Shewanella sp. Choline-02u-19]
MTSFRYSQLFLVFVFCGLTFITYSINQADFAHSREQELTKYTASIATQSNWQGNGKALYQHLTTSFNFQFFQYIDTNDSDNSFTHGKLLAESRSIIKNIYQIDIPLTRTLANGRLQVKLAIDKELTAVSNRFQYQLLLIWGTFLLISVFNVLLAALHAKKLRYSCKIIDDLPNFTFHAIQKSKLKGELTPLAKVLESCQSNLKAKVDEFNDAHEKLTRVAFQDPVTGFGTRAKFTEKLNEICLPNSQQLGVLAIVRATELAVINQLHGREAGDDYLTRIANHIRKSLVKSPNAYFYRISTADFALILPDISLKDGTTIIEELKVAFDEYQQNLGTDSVAYIGLCPYLQGCDPVSLMTLADTAVSIAQTLGPNSFHVQQKLSGDELFGDSRWKIAIDDILKRKAIKFYAQPIRPCRTNIESYRELLSRFYNDQGKFLPTTTVIAMAERHGMSEELDKLVILKTLSTLINMPSLTGLFGINISSSSANQESFVAWLKNILVRQRHLAARLVFEVSESGMQTNLSATYHFINEVHSVGARVSIERFGLGFTSFKFFKDVRPDFIKLDGSYTRGIISDTHNQFFVKMIIDIARKLMIKVIATSVENQQEKLAMEQLLLDGLQGYYIAKPTPLITVSKSEKLK